MDCFAGARNDDYPPLARGAPARHSGSGSPGCDKLTRRAKSHFRRRANHLYDSRHPVPEEGALAIVTKRWDGSCGGRDGIVRAMGGRAG